MAFQQLYYTSCQHGLLGHGGFQFNAVTPGISPVVMREVEDRTAYEPPRSMPADPRPDALAGYPVAFSYSKGSAGTSILARVVFAGDDYSGRPGNYFAHALVTASPADYGTVLPAELWDAPLWRAEPVSSTELPPFPGPPAPGPLDRELVAAFLRAGDPRLLPALLTAVGSAMAGKRPVLLAGADTAANATWIVAVSYLLGPALAPGMSFTTYSHRPMYSPHHLVGVVAGGGAAADRTFQLFDVAAGQFPDLVVHPLADLLTRVGVVQAGALWPRALALASGPVPDFDSAYPLMAAAAAQAGLALAPPDVTALVAWLDSVTPVPAGAGPVLRTLLAALGEEMSDEQAGALHGVAARIGDSAATEQLEIGLVRRAYSRLRRGEPAGDPVRLTSPAALDCAVAEYADALNGSVPERGDAPSLPPGLVLPLLRWSAAAGVVLDAAEFRQYGYFLDPSVSADLLAEIASEQPAVIDGLLARLAAHHDEARDLFARTDVITRSQLERQPGLSQPALVELWLIGARQRGRMTGLEAFGEISKLRAGVGGGAGQQVLDHQQVLSQLWPDGCPADDVAELLPVATDASQRQWLAAVTLAALQAESGAGRARVAAALQARPDVSELLPADVVKSASSLSGAASQLKQAAARISRGDVSQFGQLYATYQGGDSETRKLLRRQLVSLLCQTGQLDRALTGCPAQVRQAFAAEVGKRLTYPASDPRLAARAFAAALALQEAHQQEVAAELIRAVEPTLDWPGSVRRQLRFELGDDAAVFDDWREAQRPRAITKVQGAFHGMLRRKDR